MKKARACEGDFCMVASSCFCTILDPPGSLVCPHRAFGSLPFSFFSKEKTAPPPPPPMSSPSPSHRIKDEEEKEAGEPSGTVVDWISTPPPPSVRSTSPSHGDALSNATQHGSPATTTPLSSHDSTTPTHSLLLKEAKRGGAPAVPTPSRVDLSTETRSPPHSASSASPRSLSSLSFPPVLQGEERLKFIAAMVKVKQEEWNIARQRRVEIQQEEAEQEGNPLPPRMDEAVHVDEQKVAAALRYQAQLELHWIEEWAIQQQQQQQHEEVVVEGKRVAVTGATAGTTASGGPTRLSSTPPHSEPRDVDPQEGTEKQNGEEEKKERYPISATTRLRVKRALLERIDFRKPLAYIIGSQLFYGCRLTCTYPVMCAKEETNMWTYWLVEKYWKPAIAAAKEAAPLGEEHSPVTSFSSSSVSSGSSGTSSKATPASSFFFSSSSVTTSSLRLPALHILDLCCGNGAIGIALAKQWPSHCSVVGVDLDPRAVALAKHNAAANGMVVWEPEVEHEVEPFVSTKSTPMTSSTETIHPKRKGGTVIHRYWGLTGDMFQALQREPTAAASPPSSSFSWKEHQQEARSERPDQTNVSTQEEKERRNGKDKEECLSKISSEFLGQFDLVVCHPPYLLPREYDALSLHEQYWKPPLAVLGDPSRQGMHQYRYFKELSEITPLVLHPSSSSHSMEFHPARYGMPQLVIEVGRQASLVAELLERQPVVGSPSLEILDPKVGPNPPPRRDVHQEKEKPEKLAWQEVEVHLDAHQLPRWICARRAP